MTGNLAQLTARSLVKTRVSRAKQLFDVSDRFAAAAASQALQTRLQNPLALIPGSTISRGRLSGIKNPALGGAL